ncbi:hypothetical protein Tco_1054348 [Tanacetum coccineum]|uniref:Uncharacterized protein n=1 Tax=Tanacetum coccineum TaxID=301880 RepID=A0ABQ5GXR6_9ASTR
MASFPCLKGLAMAANSRSLFDRMMIYFERETSIDFDFAADLHNLWVQFIDCTNDRKLFISELDGLPPSLMSYNCCQFLHQVQENDFIKLLELRKMTAETYREVHKKLDFVSVMKNILSFLYVFVRNFYLTILLFIMENVNPTPANNRPVLPAALRAQAIQESTFVDSHLESIERFLNDFANQPNETNTNDLESDDESVDTPLVSPFPHSYNDSDDCEVLNELIEYENVGMLRR